MKKHLYKYLLIISLLFNLAFISIFVFRSVQMRRFNPFPPPPKEGKMNPHFKDIFRTDLRKERIENFKLRKDFFELLSVETPDYVKANIVADSLISSQHYIETKVTRNFIESRKKMTKEEAKEFFNTLGMHADRSCMRIKEKDHRRKK